MRKEEYTMKRRNMVLLAMASLLVLFATQSVFAAPTIKIGVGGAFSGDLAPRCHRKCASLRKNLTKGGINGKSNVMKMKVHPTFATLAIGEESFRLYISVRRHKPMDSNIPNSSPFLRQRPIRRLLRVVSTPIFSARSPQMTHRPNLRVPSSSRL